MRQRLPLPPTRLVWGPLLGALAIACAPSIEARLLSYLGRACFQDEDCVSDGLVCNSLTRTCQAPLLEGQRGCRASADCAPPGLCVLAAEGSGTCRNPGLGAGEACVDGLCHEGSCAPATDGELRCIVPDGAPCTDLECRDGSVCLQDGDGVGACAVRAPDGTPCTTPEACHSGACEGGFCVAEAGAYCSSDQACPANTVCRPDAAGITSCQSPGGRWEPCADQGDCGPSSACDLAAGLCLAGPGSPCTFDAECATQTCRPPESGMASVCLEPAGMGEGCDSPDDCRSGSCDTLSQQCPGGIDASCVIESSCLDGLRCVPDGFQGRRCQLAGGPGDRCDADQPADCANGRCVAEICQSDPFAACASQAECPTGTRCTRASAVDPMTCLPPQPALAYCVVSADCQVGMSCEGAECRIPSGSALRCESTPQCSGTGVCVLGACVEPQGIGGACVLHDDEPADEACAPGLICGGDLVCRPPFSQPEGSACLRGIECAANLRCDALLQICVLAGTGG